LIEKTKKRWKHLPFPKHFDQARLKADKGIQDLLLFLKQKDLAIQG